MALEQFLGLGHFFIGKLPVQGQHLLDERADRLIRQFRDSQPEFYNEYQKARIIIDAPVHRKQDSNAEEMAS